jgi:hypothetical protein
MHHHLAAGDLADAARPLAVGAIAQQQDLASARYEGGQHGLDREGAGALHRHGDEVLPAAHDVTHPVEHRLVDVDESLIA